MKDGLIKIVPRNDLVGKTFGRLTVLEQGEDYISKVGKRYSAWLCMCSCGNPNKIWVRGSHLVNGHITSCGCYAHEVVDLIGQTFGRLTVIRRAEDIVYNDINYIAWWCKCSCGNPKEIKARSKDLKDGFKQSCGCLTTERLKKYNRYDLNGEYGIGWTNKDEEFYFDLEDFDKIKNYCWFTNDSGYIIAKEGKKHISISRLLMGIKDYDWTKMYVDHINGNIKDNRRKNLRLATPSQNSMNAEISKNNSSGCTGVRKNIKGKWSALITVRRNRIYLGSFDNYEDAVKARKEAEEKYFGEFSYDNSRKKSDTTKDII